MAQDSYMYLQNDHMQVSGGVLAGHVLLELHPWEFSFAQN